MLSINRPYSVAGIVSIYSAFFLQCFFYSAFFTVLLWSTCSYLHQQQRHVKTCPNLAARKHSLAPASCQVHTACLRSQQLNPEPGELFA